MTLANRTVALAEGRQLEELAAMLDAYYALRGWTADGVPTPEKFLELGLTSVVGNLR